MKTAISKPLPHREPTDAYWVGTNIVKLRLKKKWTQEKLAAEAGISARRLRDIEFAEETNATLDTLSRLASALSVDTVDLFRKRKGDLAYQI